MLASVVTAVVRFCTRFPWPIIALALIGAIVATVYSAKHFAITTDINKLISPDLDWRKREADLEKAFPGHFGSMLVVVDAPIAEFASPVGTELAERLRTQPQLFAQSRISVVANFRPQRLVSIPRRRGSERLRPGGAADRYSCRRSQPSWTYAGSFARSHWRPEPHGDA